MMDFALKMMTFAGFTPWAWTYFGDLILKMMNFALKVVNFVLKMMYFVLRMMDFVLVILIGFGTFIAVNMFLAVISAGYEKQAEEVDEEKTMQDHAEFLLKRLSESINDALTYDHTQSEQPAEQRTNINVGDAVRLKDAAFSKFAERGRGNLTQEGGTTPVGKVLYFDRELDPSKDKDDQANLPENRNGKMKGSFLCCFPARAPAAVFEPQVCVSLLLHHHFAHTSVLFADPHRARVTTRGIEQLKPPKGTVSLSPFLYCIYMPAIDRPLE